VQTLRVRLTAWALAPGLIALGVVILLALAGCGGGDANPNPEPGTAPQNSAGTGGNDSASGQPQVPGPIETVERFYRFLNADRYYEAWAMLPASVQEEAGGFGPWRAGYGATVSSDPRHLTLASQGGGTAAVSLTLDAIDRDACTGNRIEQVFAGIWNLREVAHAWEAVAIDFTKVSGRTPTLDASECGPPPSDSGAPPPTEDCTPGYDPCLTPASDYDCEGGSGDGPEYVAGPVQVTGSDPYGLDLDSNGIGCE
jgi:hypothetical protein